MSAAWIEVTVRYIRPAGTAGGATTILVGPCERPDLTLLPIMVSPAEGALLEQELWGTATARSSALVLLGQATTALGGQVTATYLVTDRPGAVRATLEFSTSAGRVELSIEPGQALAAAVSLNLPILADRAKFTPVNRNRQPGTPPSGPYLLPHWSDE